MSKFYHYKLAIRSLCH